ncbi:WD40 repeat-like protein [Rozella allomycis CSF55]|uniref:WD40 repeat-like protein n=1 Tax=Rozella allomycis (strain CSF55) TaxID=988480 RepID=A0A4V1J0H4_ROZAC|nr:WD40 repeat-like protein [Rozella allomycis CSF55]
MEVVYVYQKQRRQFGRQINFSLTEPNLLYDYPPDHSYLSNYSIKNPLHHEVQCAQEMSEHDVNTESYAVANRGILHREGGWPKDVDSSDAEHTIRYRKKVEKDEEFLRSVVSLGDIVEECIKQNNAIDIYEEYFVEKEEDWTLEKPQAKTLNRSTTCLSWYPEDGNKLAAAYSCVDFQGQPNDMPTESYIGAEFFSSSTDGQVLWWDIRKLSEPTEAMIVDPEKNGIAVGGTILDFETTMPTKFMVGAENGSVYMCNRKAKNPNERIMHTFPGHHSPITALQRNPFFVRNFLTVGDWSAKIWTEDIRSPIMSTNYHSYNLTDGCWSPTRPAVFFTSKDDGTVDVWDYLFKQTEPTLSIQVCDSPIQCIRIQDRGSMIAVGSRDGTTSLLEISSGISKIQRDEKNIFSQMLERETKREKTLETAARDKRLKAAQKKPQSANPNDFLKGNSILEAIQQAEQEFMEYIQNMQQGNTKE